jgi:hypothetical protein
MCDEEANPFLRIGLALRLYNSVISIERFPHMV